MSREISDTGIVEMVTKAEYDIQIATARQYPRSIKKFIDSATEIVCLNTQIADECIYALPRDGKNIEGPSARFAEIIVSSWGHCRSGARVIAEDDRFITAQAVCHDLQNNNLITLEVRRRITTSKGKRFGDDMIGVTGSAATSIALRNAILKVVPKAFWSPIYDQARKVVMGDAKTLANRRSEALNYLQKLGATPEMVLNKLGVKGIEDVTLEHLITLKGYCTAIKEGEHTVESVFNEKTEPKERKEVNEINEILNQQVNNAVEKQAGSGEGAPPVEETQTGSNGGELERRAAAIKEQFAACSTLEELEQIRIESQSDAQILPENLVTEIMTACADKFHELEKQPTKE